MTNISCTNVETDLAATLLLTREVIASRVPPDAYVDAIRAAFRRLAAAELETPAVGHVPGCGGAFHIKAAASLTGVRRAAVKINGNFPDNPARHGLPTIQGFIALLDAQCGHLLALMDSAEITAQRTAAASVVAAQLLARPAARRLALIGCGVQARYHLIHFTSAFAFDSIACCDLRAESADAFAAFGAQRSLRVEIAKSAQAAAAGADIVVTCTPSRVPILHVGNVAPGCFIAAVGADNPHKQEIDAKLMGQAKVVCDVLEQCAGMGDLHHALQAGAMRREDVYAELGELVAGKKIGRDSQQEIIVFDSTGMALQDVAAAAILYEKAERQNVGVRLDFAA
jgi:alanine dehydrogenase